MPIAVTTSYAIFPANKDVSTDSRKPQATGGAGRYAETRVWRRDLSLALVVSRPAKEEPHEGHQRVLRQDSAVLRSLRSLHQVELCRPSPEHITAAQQGNDAHHKGNPHKITFAARVW